MDHVMLSEGFRIKHLGRLRITGADHFDVVAILSLDERKQGVQPKPVDDDTHEGPIVREAINEARDRGVKSQLALDNPVRGAYWVNHLLGQSFSNRSSRRSLLVERRRS